MADICHRRKANFNTDPIHKLIDYNFLKCLWNQNSCQNSERFDNSGVIVFLLIPKFDKTLQSNRQSQNIWRKISLPTKFSKWQRLKKFTLKWYATQIPNNLSAYIWGTYTVDRNNYNSYSWWNTPPVCIFKLAIFKGAYNNITAKI